MYLSNVYLVHSQWPQRPLRMRTGVPVPCPRKTRRPSPPAVWALGPTVPWSFPVPSAPSPHPPPLPRHPLPLPPPPLPPGHAVWTCPAPCPCQTLASSPPSWAHAASAAVLRPQSVTLREVSLTLSGGGVLTVPRLSRWGGGTKINPRYFLFLECIFGVPKQKLNKSNTMGQ